MEEHADSEDDEDDAEDLGEAFVGHVFEPACAEVGEGGGGDGSDRSEFPVDQIVAGVLDGRGEGGWDDDGQGSGDGDFLRETEEADECRNHDDTAADAAESGDHTAQHADGEGGEEGD